MEKEEVEKDVDNIVDVKISLTHANVIFFKTLLIINIVLMILPMVGGVIAFGLNLLLMFAFIIRKIYLDSKKENQEYNEKRFNNSFNNRTCFLLACFSFISIFADFGCMCTSDDYIIVSIFYVFAIFLPVMIMYLKKVSSINGDYKKLNRIFLSFILTVIVVGLLMNGLILNIDKNAHTIVASNSIV